MTFAISQHFLIKFKSDLRFSKLTFATDDDTDTARRLSRLQPLSLKPELVDLRVSAYVFIVNFYEMTVSFRNYRQSKKFGRIVYINIALIHQFNNFLIPNSDLLWNIVVPLAQ